MPTITLKKNTDHGTERLTFTFDARVEERAEWGVRMMHELGGGVLSDGLSSLVAARREWKQAIKEGFTRET